MITLSSFAYSILGSKGQDRSMIATSFSIISSTMSMKSMEIIMLEYYERQRKKQQIKPTGNSFLFGRQTNGIVINYFLSIWLFLMVAPSNDWICLKIVYLSITNWNMFWMLNIGLLPVSKSSGVFSCFRRHLYFNQGYTKTIL